MIFGALVNGSLGRGIQKVWNGPRSRAPKGA